MSFDKSSKIVITGAAGLVGQNLCLLMSELGYNNLVAIDRNRESLSTLKKLNPGVSTIHSDLSSDNRWESGVEGASVVILLHAQITGTSTDQFRTSNIVATKKLLKSCLEKKVGYLVHISSSVVNSIADDDYTQTKKMQEEQVVNSGIRHCVLRPTLMFGWFDAKHLGWLARFMAKTPVFPVPGKGDVIRQPLYNRDFCRAITWCIENQPDGTVYDIVGPEKITYINLVRMIRKTLDLKTWILPIPVPVFRGLLKFYALLFRNPPFTVDQLDALLNGDIFIGVDMEETFGFRPTPLEQAIDNTFNDSNYSGITLTRYLEEKG